jgi:hypothetical protein
MSGYIAPYGAYGYLGVGALGVAILCLIGSVIENRLRSRSALRDPKRLVIAAMTDEELRPYALEYLTRKL